MNSTPGDRAIVALGLLPLAAAAVWLVLLRKPTAVVAYPGAPQPPVTNTEAAAQPGPRYPGVVVAGQDAELGAELSGEVVRVFAEPGTRLQRGEPILQLAALSAVESQGIANAQAQEDRSAIEAARLSLEIARDKADRMQSAPSAYPQREIQSARNEASKAAAELQRLRANAAVRHATAKRELARADKQILRAPFDGLLAARFVDAGDWIAAGQPLARVVDDARFVRFALPAPEHARLAAGDPVRVWSDPAGRDAPHALPLEAAVVDVDPELDTASGLGFARAALRGAAAALPPGARLAVGAQP